LRKIRNSDQSVNLAAATHENVMRGQKETG